MSFPDKYNPMRDRAAPFAASANWVLAFIACLILWYGAMLILTTVIWTWAASPRIATRPEVLDAFYEGSTPGGVFWNLASFGVYIALLWVILRGFHRLPIDALFGGRAETARTFGRVCFFLVPIYAIAFGPSISDPNVYQQMDVGRWLLLLLIGLPLLFVQIGAEELVFRGYLQSHLAALSKNPIVWMVVPSALFGLIHYDGTQPTYSAWAYVAWATGLGLVCADVTARSGTLGPALAIHFINNIGAMFVLAADDWIYGAALFIWPTFGQPWEPWVPFEALFLFTIWLTARLAIRR